MDPINDRKEATRATIEHQEAVKAYLPFEDDLENSFDGKNVAKGLVKGTDGPSLVIEKDDGEGEAWNMDKYQEFISYSKEAPDTVNPSLWRLSQFNVRYGLYKVADGIWQVRAYDLGNVTFIAGETGWIVCDPLISVECARAALKIMRAQQLHPSNEKPEKVSAVIYSHSHIVTYGGVRGLFDDGTPPDNFPIYAPEEDFTEHAVSENVIAGNVMGRRSMYMYAATLPRDEKGNVGTAMGQTNSTGSSTMLPPTHTITEENSAHPTVVDGVTMHFQLTPGTEAPAGMNVWFEKSKCLWTPENTTYSMHNILTLRGAEIRDTLRWAHYLTETINKWGSEAEVKFQTHHWPIWGNDNVLDNLKKQRDVYKYIHDQSVRLMNNGFVDTEIAEMIKLPPSLDKVWSTRGYYGTLKHNSRAVYQKYMGWYSGNPSDLDNLPPVNAGQKYMLYMGGEDAVVKKAKFDFENAEYRWVAEVLKHAVFANPNNESARALLADTYEQLGYQAESGAWRNIYLQGAFELRSNLADIAAQGAYKPISPDIISAMEPPMLFDYLAAHLDPSKALDKSYKINIVFLPTDKTSTTHTLSLENCVLVHYENHPVPDPDVTMTMSKDTLNDILLGNTNLEDAVQNGDVSLNPPDSLEMLLEFFGLFDEFEFWFNIVLPRGYVQDDSDSFDTKVSTTAEKMRHPKRAERKQIRGNKLRRQQLSKHFGFSGLPFHGSC